MGGILTWAVQGLLPGVLLSGAAWFANAARSRTSARRRWALKDPGSLLICLAESTVVATGEYSKPATGLGQAKALSLLAPSLLSAYRDIDLERVSFSGSAGGDQLETDLLLIGGPRNNRLSRELLRRVGESLGVQQEGSVITANGTKYEGIADGSSVSLDYGLILRVASPFNKSRTALLVSGSHTYGVAAAARFLTTSPLFTKHGGDLAVVVASEIDNHHALPPTLVWTSADD